MADNPPKRDHKLPLDRSQAKPAVFGHMAPIGGGDPIPLLKRELLIGRRESCDIVLRFANVSANHCQLFLDGGYWYIKDLKSRNGTRINGTKISEHRIDPGDELQIAKHRYLFTYSPIDLGAVGPPPDDDISGVFSATLIQRLGLDRRQSDTVAAPGPRERIEISTEES
jgi:pSer/pThr/pTyr-binding forkhead associated (FHA) protein